MTYPNKAVVQHLSEHFVCFKPRVDAHGVHGDSAWAMKVSFLRDKK